MSYAILTETGLDKLRNAAPGHIEDIDRQLAGLLDEEEMRTLTELLGRLANADGQSCTPDE